MLKTAFRKLLTYTYYDKSDMVLRYNVASFARRIAEQTEEDKVFEQIQNVAEGKDQESLDKWLDQISLVYLPKKLTQNGNRIDQHLITNIPPQEAITERLIVKASFPVELLILDVAWVMNYGYKADACLSKNSYGNRIDVIANNSAVRKGNSLFKKYHTQYRKWWENGVRKANEKLKEGINVTIVNFDITDCYHSIDFDFGSFFDWYEQYWKHDNIREDQLTAAVQQIYERYWTLTQSSDASVFEGENKGKHPMPLTMMSSHIFANWYLNPLDDYLEKAIPVLYYGRYVDDCMVVLPTKSVSPNSAESINTELPGLLEWKDEKTVVFKFAEEDRLPGAKRLQTFTIQTDKLYIYRFNCELPQSSIDKFAAEQKEHSSEYRFLTDEEDTSYEGLEFVTLINALDAEEEKGRRFSILEENRYKLSVYIAKLSSRLARFGKNYSHHGEVKKVFDYFQGDLLIKHYLLWERLMTVFVLGEEQKLVEVFAERVRAQIDKLDVADGVFTVSKDAGQKALKRCLSFHLEQSYLMAMSLHRGESGIDTLYLDTFMMRTHYNIYPMQEFAVGYRTVGVKIGMQDMHYDTTYLNYRWMPYYVKLYEMISMFSIGKPYDPAIIDEAFAAFQRLNGNANEADHLKAMFRHPKEDVESEFNTWLNVDPCVQENITVSVVNMDVTDRDGNSQIENFGKIDIDKIKTFQQILDQIEKIESTDIFILPEMSLPYYELNEYCRRAATHEIAFVAGMEYVVKGKEVYNYIVTCLPVILYGQMDAIPVIRLKNHYAPEEVKNIEGKGYTVPLNLKMWQNLYHWRNHVFTTYYCYELASIIERSHFFSMIDAMYCPVFNPDTYYYNNIAESLARDMHCFFILSNVSHYGDSRVTRPAKHDRMNMLKVKGGNTKDNKAVVLSAVLPIEELRNFQMMEDREQKAYLEAEKVDGFKYKMTPPGYNRDALKERKNNRFILPYDDYTDEFLSKLYEYCLQYQAVREA